MLKVLVVVPTYNEVANIRSLIPLLTKVLSQHGVEGHILVVDDCSPDGTGEAVRRMVKECPQLHLLSRRRKLGAGSAYKDGFRWAATSFDPDAFMQMDADFSHDPAMLLEMISSVREGFDLVLGSRYVAGGGIRGWPWHRRLISTIANFVARGVLKIPVKDATSGFRAMSRRAVRGILGSNLRSKGYSYQIESLFLLTRSEMKVKELPYTFKARRTGKSKLSVMEIIQFVFMVARLSMKRLKAFSFLSHMSYETSRP